MRRWAFLVLGLAPLGAFAGAQKYEPLADSVRARLFSSVADRAPAAGIGDHTPGVCLRQQAGVGMGQGSAYAVDVGVGLGEHATGEPVAGAAA